ncbi:glucan endo-1,3-beta-glucosidase-like [Arachis duranensis]|uniref:glucan endo-1,3-beta-D-glucosidase n=1 Tax=Arachis duranensis TaxID=130453 RepID=A0A6P4CJZ2_ARADU|nr:glucan endo-1,3-beta-glucosidase-like [Arachis duranensis]
MFFKSNVTMLFMIFFGFLLSIGLEFTAAQSPGVCYGMIAGNLPSKKETIDLYKSFGITRMRIYFPEAEVFEALKGSNIELTVDVAKESLQAISSNPNAAKDWVNTNIVPYSKDIKFRYITVGNEIHPGDVEAQYVFSGMQNIHDALASFNLGQIKASTAIDSSLLGKSYPPSDGAFSDAANAYMQKIINFLVPNGSPLLANIYPYFAYASDQVNIPLEYALFTQQGKNDVGYQNLFDAMLDSTYAALEKIGANNLQIVVSESGWPSFGGVGTSIQNAGAYYQNLINHVKSGTGTPKRPNQPIEVYLFAMYDENQKPGAETERHFGLLHADKSRKFPFNFK